MRNVKTGEKHAAVTKMLPEMVAGFQIDCDGRVREVLEVDCEHLLGHVVVVKLVVAERHVHVQGQVLPMADL